MPDTSDDIQRKIDHLEGQRAILGDAIVNEMIAKLRAEIPSAGETHGTATTHDNYGQNIGVNLGVAIFGRDPREDERRRLIWYLDWLCGDLDQLRLHMLEKKLDQRGAGMSLSSVYVMLATQNRYGVTVEDWQDELVLSSYIDNGVNFSDLQNLLMSGNERFVSLLKPQHQPDWGLPSDVITWGALSPADQIDSVPEQSSGLVCTLARALLATEAVQQHQHLVLLGNPGSGKSTFLRHLALLLARRGLGQVGDDDAALPRELTTKLPIILPLQRLSRHLAAEGVSDATVVAALKAELARSSVTQVDDLLSESLHRGAALLLLDGLDEVPLEGVPGERVDRQTVVQAVRDFALHYSRVTVVLTCRVRAFSDDLRAHLGWPVETLAPFTLGQMRHFVPAWYGELVRTNQLSAEQATYYEQTLIDALVQRPRLKEMAETPLLLTMMALVLYNKNELPRDRPRLYEDILDLLLRRWDTIPDKGGQTLTAAMGRPDWDSRNIVSLLDQLSYEAHRDATSDDGRGRLPRYAVQGRLSDHMQAQGMGRGEAGSAALHCLDYIEQRSGLLVPDENDSYVFAHLTLQEHCAGRHIALNSEDPIGLIMQHRHDDRWREPIFLGMGLADPLYLNELLNELVDRDEPEQPKPVERWYRDLILAAELGKDRDWHYLQTQPRVKVKRLQASLRAGLVELLNDATQPLPAAERVRAGFLLGDLGDPRFPVTIEEWKAEAEKVLSGDTSGYFCKVEPGTYLIGSSDDNPDAEDEEEPQHTVTFDRPFWIARYPITKVQYIGWETRQESEGATSDLISPIRLSSNQPIEVSKWLAINFCSWIGFQIQENVRLPTHEEWIAVIRGVNNTRYSWGDNWNENCISDNRPLNTVPVGCFPKGASHCGAMDMLGTVFEWTVGETRAITSSELLALKETPSSFSGFRIVLAPLDSTTTYEDD